MVRSSKSDTSMSFWIVSYRLDLGYVCCHFFSQGMSSSGITSFRHTSASSDTGCSAVHIGLGVARSMASTSAWLMGSYTFEIISFISSSSCFKMSLTSPSLICQWKSCSASIISCWCSATWQGFVMPMWPTGSSSVPSFGLLGLGIPPSAHCGSLQCWGKGFLSSKTKLRMAF